MNWRAQPAALMSVCQRNHTSYRGSKVDPSCLSRPPELGLRHFSLDLGLCVLSSLLLGFRAVLVWDGLLTRPLGESHL